MSLYNHQSLFLYSRPLLPLFHIIHKTNRFRPSVCLLLLTPPTNPTQPSVFLFTPRFQLPSQKGAVGRCVPTYTPEGRSSNGSLAQDPNERLIKDFCAASRMLIGTYLTWLPNHGKLLVTLLDIPSMH
jgi:hypothetical protein